MTSTHKDRHEPPLQEFCLSPGLSQAKKKSAHLKQHSTTKKRANLLLSADKPEPSMRHPSSETEPHFSQPKNSRSLLQIQKYKQATFDAQRSLALS